MTFDFQWITSTPTAILMVFVSGAGIYLALLLLTRILGLRSFSKMSGFDFPVTVAIGAVIAATLLLPEPSLLQGTAGLAALFGTQYAIGLLRRKSERIRSLLENRPLLVMAGPDVVSGALEKAQITQDELHSRLRLAGITHPSQVLAVIVEPTGEVAVLRATDQVDYDLFSDVAGAEHLRPRQQRQ